MPIRNPFAKRTDVQASLQPLSDENAASRTSFERVSTVGSRASSMSIKTGKSEGPPEYKMSEKKSFWPRRAGNLSATSVNTRTTSNDDIDPFPISRESFDSYRRSFDISARSPISPVDGYGSRQSLDSVRMPRMPRSAIGDRRFDRQPPTAEEGFEDVGLNDEANKQHQQQTKKKGFFSRIGDDAFHIPGRKRGQSGTGEELGSIPKPNNAPSAVEATEVH
ncbi:pumilio y domain family member 6 protein [Rutstroemia sp. NJR-2017a WRK4]|nr:pumilio y domain family member 6 protein [Rutstroemia sp. NJR-2017a WRK4]PQE14888.1 pumilio y domain family member 6 protein [Rutstroemia sp. NJR-2017a WRK4]